MVKYSIIEKFNVLLTIIKSSPFFLTCFIVGTFLLSFVILDFKTTKKVRNKFMLLSLILTIGFIIYKYYNYLITLSDNLVEEIFMAIYFPNLAVYTIVIVSTNICLFVSLLKKKLQNEYKVANIFSTILLDFLFILILETIIKNKIDVYETLTVYSNKELLILIELSTAIYTAWLLVIGFMKLIDKTVRKEVVEAKKPLPVYEAPSYNSYEVNTVNETPVFVNNDYTNVFNIEPNQNFTEEENIVREFQTIDQPVVENYKDMQFTMLNQENKIEETFSVDEAIAIEPVNEEINLITPLDQTEEPAMIEEKKSFISLFTKNKKEIVENVQFTELNQENNIEENSPVNETIVIEPVRKLDQIEIKETFSVDETIAIEPVKEETNLISPLNQVTKERKEKKNFIKLFDNKLLNNKKEEQSVEYRVPLFETLNDDAIMNCIVPIQKEKIVPIVKKPEITVEIDGKELLAKFNRGEKLDVEQYKILKDYIVRQGI